MPGVVSTALFGNSVHAVLEDGEEGRGRLIRALSSAGLISEKVESVEPTLEDVFLHLVRQRETVRV
jgi:hypothetical protein